MPRRAPPVRPRRGHLRAHRALDPAGALPHMYGGWDGREPAHPTYGRASNWLEPGERGGDPPHARPLRRGGHAHRPLARPAGRPAPRPEPRARDGRARGRPRNPARRSLDGPAGADGALPGATRVPLIPSIPRAAGEDRERLVRVQPRPGPDDPSMAGVRGRAHDGRRLSRPFPRPRAPDREYAWGGSSDSFFIRSRRWMLWGYNRPGNFKLFDRRRDPGTRNNLAASLPGVVARTAPCSTGRRPAPLVRQRMTPAG